MVEVTARLSASPLLPRTGARGLRPRAPGLTSLREARFCYSLGPRPTASATSNARACGARCEPRATLAARTRRLRRLVRRNATHFDDGCVRIASRSSPRSLPAAARSTRIKASFDARAGSSPPKVDWIPRQPVTPTDSGCDPATSWLDRYTRHLRWIQAC